MTGDANLTMTAIGLLLAGWMAAAGYAVWSGMRMRGAARRTIRQSARLGRLIETAPAIPLVVRADGRIEMSDRLKGWLGLSGEIRHLADLEGQDDAGIDAADVQALAADVRTIQRTGETIQRNLRLSGTGRAVRVVGALSDAQLYANSSALLWFFDATESESERERLNQQVEEATAAFDALSRLVERAPVPMWYRSADLRLAMVNSAYVRAVGDEDADQVIALGHELLEAHEGETPQAAAARALESDGAVERLLPATIDGQRRQLRVVDLPLGNGGVAGFAIDEQALAEVRAAFSSFADAQRSILDALSSAVAQFDVDRTLTFANLPFRRLFAFADSRPIEGTEFPRLLDHMRDVGRLPEVRDFPAWRADRDEWFRSTEVVEESWHLPDGSHLRVLAQPAPDGGLLMVVEDRTEQVQLATARDTLLRVRTATFDNLSEAVAVLGGDGRFNLWNRKFTELWAVADDALDDHPRLDAFLQQVAGQLRKPAMVSSLLERVRVASSQRTRKRGKVEFADGRMFQFGATPLPDGNVLFNMLDVTDSRRIEQALQERNDALVEADGIKARFLSNMAYELRTPLTSINGFADLLIAGIGGPLPDTAHEYVAAISEAAARLTGQIDTVLDFSQSEAGALPLRRQVADVRVILEALVTSAQKQAAAKDIELRLECRDSAGQLSCDQRRLNQALGHVLDNAITYTAAGGSAFVFADGGFAAVRIVISDNGPGMDNRKQARVFDTFGRAQDGDGGVGNETGASDGGLGLPLARQLVEAHGGTLTLMSEPGEGTAVNIALPRE